MVFTVDLADIDFSYSLWAVNFYHTGSLWCGLPGLTISIIGDGKTETDLMVAILVPDTAVDKDCNFGWNETYKIILYCVFVSLTKDLKAIIQKDSFIQNWT